jgi:hypothetical protein
MFGDQSRFECVRSDRPTVTQMRVLSRGVHALGQFRFQSPLIFGPTGRIIRSNAGFDQRSISPPEDVPPLIPEPIAAVGVGRLDPRHSYDQIGLGERCDITEFPVLGSVSITTVWFATSAIEVYPTLTTVDPLPDSQATFPLDVMIPTDWIEFPLFGAGALNRVAANDCRY